MFEFLGNTSMDFIRCPAGTCLSNRSRFKERRGQRRRKVIGGAICSIRTGSDRAPSPTDVGR